MQPVQVAAVVTNPFWKEVWLGSCTNAQKEDSKNLVNLLDWPKKGAPETFLSVAQSLDADRELAVSPSTPYPEAHLATPTFFREVVLFGLLVHLAAPAFQALCFCLKQLQEPVAIPAAGPWLGWLCWRAGGGLQPGVWWGQRGRFQGRVTVVSIGEVALDLGNLGGLPGASINTDGVGVRGTVREALL